MRRPVRLRPLCLHTRPLLAAVAAAPSLAHNLTLAQPRMLLVPVLAAVCGWVLVLVLVLLVVVVVVRIAGRPPVVRVQQRQRLLLVQAPVALPLLAARASMAPGPALLLLLPAEGAEGVRLPQRLQRQRQPELVALGLLWSGLGVATRAYSGLHVRERKR